MIHLPRSFTADCGYDEQVENSGQTTTLTPSSAPLPVSFVSAARRARELWRAALSPLLGAPLWRSVLAAMRAHPLLLVSAARESPAGATLGDEQLASLPQLGATRLARVDGQLETEPGDGAARALGDQTPAALLSHAPSLFAFASAFLRSVRIRLASALEQTADADALRAFLSQNGVLMAN